MPNNLFTPASAGALTLAHRVVHAPTTRLRAEADENPSAMMVEYYRQRASRGGLIITESAHPSHDSRGYLGAPCIYADRHVQGWRSITDAVHYKGGTIVMQIAHDGRQSHVDLSDGAAPIAPSVVPFEGQALTRDGWVPVSPHREILIDEIPALVESFRRGAARAKAAGFDGIELHNANGYLADTFLQDGTNRRTDAYGGPSPTAIRSGPSGPLRSASTSTDLLTCTSLNRVSAVSRRSGRVTRPSPPPSCAGSSRARSSLPVDSTAPGPRLSCSAGMQTSWPSAGSSPPTLTCRSVSAAIYSSPLTSARRSGAGTSAATPTFRPMQQPNGKG